jgi:hypothetical protein
LEDGVGVREAGEAGDIVRMADEFCAGGLEEDVAEEEGVEGFG